MVDKRHPQIQGIEKITKIEKLFEDPAMTSHYKITQDAVKNKGG